MAIKQKRPSDSFIDALKTGFAAIKSLSEPERLGKIGRHVPTTTLQNIASGEDLTQSADRDVHIALCAACSKKLHEFEKRHISRVREREKQVVRVRASTHENQNVLTCRDLRLEITNDTGAVLLAVRSNEAGTILSSLVVRETGKRLPRGFASLHSPLAAPASAAAVGSTENDAETSAPQVQLGTVADIAGKTLQLSFRFKGRTWKKAIRF